ncbi:hypothetical protein TNCT_668301 [Trichonephila clavata]|uniref:Uncharacterized protein n=1 Tax=Trichonephila clavata TaxID=2740835 RepID=A0A8X6KP16_TRICU|nr:hypothetical protein TNCT_668301 [Trichonephila clavata]
MSRSHCACRLFICGEYTVMKYQRNTADFVKKLCYVYFGLRIRDQDNVWTAHKVCDSFVEKFRLWYKGELQSLKFSISITAVGEKQKKGMEITITFVPVVFKVLIAKIKGSLTTLIMKLLFVWNHPVLGIASSQHFRDLDSIY